MVAWGAIGAGVKSFLGENFASILGAGSDLLGGALSYEQQKQLMNDQYNYSLQLQQQNQNWQTEMSNTAHQREVKDLIASGINPVYTATGGSGASFGSVGTGTVSGAQSPQYNPFQRILDAQNMRNQTNATDSDVMLKASYAQHEVVKMQETRAKILNILEDTNLKGSQRNLILKQLREIDANINMLNANAKYLMSNAKYITGRTALLGKDQGENYSYSESVNTPIFSHSTSRTKGYNRY